MKNIQQGLRENWQQFSYLVIVNAFVGGMLGLERTVLPQLAEQEFGITSKTAIFSFIITFGITKAICNYFTGKWANGFGRKKLLVLGWFFALPIPFMLIYAESWTWIVLTNILLGINQGLTWSMAVVMKIDLVGDKNRGLAVGINEFAGYLSVGIVAFLTGFLAEQYGIRPYPFYIGILFSFLGLGISIFKVKDTGHHVLKETLLNNKAPLLHPFLDTSFRHKSLSSITQAGLINNLNDGMIWGLLPLLLLTQHFGPTTIGVISAVYPSVWGISQLFTGRLSDIYSKKLLLFWGMLIQGLAIMFLTWACTFTHFILIGVTLGLGTALVYPTFLSSIADYTNPTQRAECLGTFRFWRDLGYAIGALLTATLADAFGIDMSITFIGVLTIISGIIILIRMDNQSALPNS